MLGFLSINIRCHKRHLSSILVARKCRQYVSSTLGGFESLLLHPMSMWNDNRRQIGSNGACYSFNLGPRCATRIFKLPMKSCIAQAMAKMMALTTNKAHPIVVNPLTCLWHVINIFQLLFPTFLEYLNLAKIATIHILGSIEDEQCFNSISFLKDKVRNHLNPHCN